MKLFTRDIDKKLFSQYPKGASLENQVVVAKIFNPYGSGRWYLLNSDPSDPDYLWAIVQINGEPETGSVSRKQLENIRVKPFNLPLERDLYFSPINALELYQGLLNGKIYKAGGMTEASENKEMLLNQSEEFEHHAEELESAVKKADHIPAWVVAKSERASTDLSDITHYLDGENEQREEMTEGEEEYADGGEIKWQDAHYGDNALVVSENKMGIIIKPYGRKFHLKFPDGTEKTYDASELKFFGDMDDFDRGGEMSHGGEVGGLSADEAIYLYIKKAINQPYREKYLKPAGLWNTPKMKEVEQSLKKKGYLNGAGAINETGKNKAREVDASVDRIISREYISSNNPKAVYSEIVEKFHSNGKMASGGRLDVGRYYKTTDGRQVRYLGDTKDPEVGTFTNKADGVFMVRYDEIEGKASLFDEGGEVEEGVDLFEDYDDIPSNVQEVLDKYSDAFEDGNYKELEKANKELKKIGYTFEYGLDGQAYDLRKVGEKGKSEYMAKGGIIAIEKKGDKKVATIIHNGNVFFVEYYIDNPELKHIKGDDANIYFGVVDNNYQYGKSDKEYIAVTKKLVNAIKNNKVTYYEEGGKMADGGQTDFGDFYEWSSKEVGKKFNSQFDEGFPIVKFVKDSINKVVESASGVLKNGKTVVFNVDSVEWEQSDKMASGGMMEKGGKTEKEYKVGDKVIYAPNGKWFGAKNVSNIKKGEITDVGEISGKKVYTLEFKNKFGQIVNTVQTYNTKEIDLDPDVKMASGGMMKKGGELGGYKKGDKVVLKYDIVNRIGAEEILVVVGFDEEKLVLDSTSKKIGKSKNLQRLSYVYPNDVVHYEDFINTKMAEGGMTDPMATVNEIARLSGVRPIAIAEWGDKNNINLTFVLKDLKSKKIKGMDIMTAIVGNPNNKYQKELSAKYSKMAMGGKVKFADKVKAIKKSLLERKKVSPKVQKDYGKTYSPKEAEESAKRIVGAMTAKERLMAKRKKSKK